MRATADTGAPLDDTYIFLQYAENIAAGQGFAFNPGEPSAGVTSLLYPFVLAALMRIAPDAPPTELAQGVGLVSFASIGGMLVWNRAGARTDHIAGLLLAVILGTWPILYMNALSGMETLAYLAAIVAVSRMVLHERPRWPFVRGLAVGHLFLWRPDGLIPAAALTVASVWAMRARTHAQCEGDFCEPPELTAFPRRDALVLLAGALAPVWCALAAVYVLTDGAAWLPTTYAGKLASAAPTQDAITRAVAGVEYAMKGYATFSGVGAVLAAVAVGGFLVHRMRTHKTPGYLLSGWVLIALLGLPFVYGVLFPASPPFGGYYQRYLAPTALALAVAAHGGALALWAAAQDRLEPLSAPRRRRAAAGGLLIALGVAVWYGRAVLSDAQFHKAVYDREVRRNEVVRSAAAAWIREHVSPEARVLVGYTGLGVVGADCGRYVKDLGGLINPDMYPYLDGTHALTRERWAATRRYMGDFNLSYYVTDPDIDTYPHHSDSMREVFRYRSAELQATAPDEHPHTVAVYEFNSGAAKR